MKKFIRLLAIIISLIVCITCFVSCSNNGGETDETPPTIATATDIDLVKNGQTGYKIVISKNASDYENYAVKELVLYLKESTNCDFEIVTDEFLKFDEKDKVLSVGRTKILEESGVEVSYDKLKRDGLVIKRLGNTVILCGGGDYGTLYAVYEFLYQQIEWEAFAADEIYFVKTRNLKLLDFNFTDKPDMEHRVGGWFAAATDPYFAAKWRAYAGSSGIMLFNIQTWFFFPHAIFRMVPPTTYANDHPDWYSPSKKQPCFTNQEFKAQLVANLKQLILDNPDVIFWPFGLEDYEGEMCHCSKCNAEIDAYQESGMVVRWVNDVVAEIVKWKEEMGIERELYFPYLAYYEILIPPTNEKGEPIDNTCVLNEYSPVIYADIAAENDWPYTNLDYNGKTYNQLTQWAKCSKSMMNYFYTNRYVTRFEWAETIYTHTENYALGAKYNSMLVFDDCSNTLYQACGMQHMLGYIYAKLQWDTDIDTNVMVEKFITHYYREAADDVRNYYYLMKMQLAQCMDNVQLNGGQCGFLSEHTSEAFTKGILEQALTYLDQGIQKIKDCDHYTDAEKERYIQRVEIEKCTPLLYILDERAPEYTDKGYLERVDQMEALVNKYGITDIRRENNADVPNEKVFSEWRANKNDG